MSQPASPLKWDATDYARNASAQYLWAAELIDKLALRGGERLLDVGCGDGRISAELGGGCPAARCWASTPRQR